MSRRSRHRCEEVLRPEVGGERRRAKWPRRADRAAASRPRRRTPPISRWCARCPRSLADEGDAEDRNLAPLQGLDRQQAVVDGAERASMRTSTTGSSQRANRSICSSIAVSAAPSGRRRLRSRAAGRHWTAAASPATRSRCRRARRRGAARRACVSAIGLRQDALRPAGRTAAARSAMSVSPVEARLHRLPVVARRAQPTSAAAKTVLPTSVSVPVTTMRVCSCGEPLSSRARASTMAATLRLVDVERQREAQPRGALRHGRRADRADVEAARLHGGSQRASRARRRRRSPAGSASPMASMPQLSPELAAGKAQRATAASRAALASKRQMTQRRAHDGGHQRRRRRRVDEGARAIDEKVAERAAAPARARPWRPAPCRRCAAR